MCEQSVEHVERAGKGEYRVTRKQKDKVPFGVSECAFGITIVPRTSAAFVRTCEYIGMTAHAGSCMVRCGRSVQGSRTR
jgi:hypothetical protein